MNLCKILFLTLLCGSGLSSATAQAHTRLKSSDVIKPRGTDPGIKTGPCGGLPRVANPPVLKSGQEIVVPWEETIHHPGRFEIYFSMGYDQNFILLGTIQNTQNDNNVPHQYSATVQLPNVTCNECTLQLIQVMLDDPNNPRNYYSCADLKLEADSVTPQPTPAPVATPSPTPKPASVDNCSPSSH